MKQKNEVAGFISIILALATMGLGSVAFAQVSALDDSVPPPGENMPKAVLVATVNVGDAQATKQEGNDWKVSFGLSNRIGIQPGVRYSVELRSADKGILADRIVYPEVISLGENEIVKKEVVYAVPDYLKGKFKFWVVVRSEKGMLFGQAVTSEVELSGDGKSLDFNLAECTLKISGDEKIYQPGQGVDVLPEEEMTLRCAIQNMFDSEMSATPHFKTTFRTAFGQIISEEDGQAIQFKESENKILTLTLPKAQFPQAYDMQISFRDSEEKIISKPIVVHYVLRGASATIQNMTLDKDAYTDGSTAALSLYWSGRADYFPGTRHAVESGEKTFLNIKTMNSKGVECAKEEQKEFETNNQGGLEVSNIYLNDKCLSGKMAATLTDERGKVLDGKTIEFGKKEDGNNEQGRSLPFPYWIAIGILIVGIGVVVVLKRRQRVSMAILFLILLGSMFLGGRSARADSFETDLPNGGKALYTANLDRVARDYCSGNSVTVTGTSEFSACSNTADSTGMTAYFMTNGGFIFDQGHVFFSDCNTNGWGSRDYFYATTEGTGSFKAQIVGRTYLTSSCGSNPSYSNKIETSYYIPYTVTDITNASCGSANGVATPTAPASNLCGVGETASAVTASGSNWVWTCSSSVTCRLAASCSAPNNVTCAGTRCDGKDITRNVGQSVCGTDLKFYTCGASGIWAGPGAACTCLVPFVTTGCSGVNSVANITLAAVGGASNYQVRVDTDSNTANGFWYKNVSTLSNDNVPVGFLGFNGFSNFSGYFSPGVTYYTNASYYNSSWGYLGIESPWKSFVAQSCYQCTAGDDTTGATLCSGDESGLPSNTPKSVVSTCSSPAGPKCEYQCNTAGGFRYFAGLTPKCRIPFPCPADPVPGVCNPSCGDNPVGTRTKQTYIRRPDNLGCDLSAPFNESCPVPRCPNVYREVAP